MGEGYVSSFLYSEYTFISVCIFIKIHFDSLYMFNFLYLFFILK
ncbi:hypothetical protein bthur0005_38440 [Bacillus thuringiensis serovar pakistani str. T13001]|nr:hypothetical protein bthur0005_38440 [Bacillus thuringiensis serovar pakistani str. T13001]